MERKNNKLQFDELIRLSVNHYFEEKYDVTDAEPEIDEVRYQQGLIACKKALRARQKNKKIQRTKRFGVIAACALVMVSVFLMVEGDFTQAELMFSEQREITDTNHYDSTVVDPLEENQDMIGNYQYTIGYVPEGYALADEYYSEAIGGKFRYEKDEQILVINYFYERASVSINTDNESIEQTQITVDGDNITVGTIKETGMQAYWMWEQEGVFFFVDGELPEAEFKMIYEGIK